MNATCAKPIQVLSLFIVFICFMVTGLLSRHALERHPIDAPNAVACMDRNGIDFEMVDPSTGRIAKVCHEPNQNYIWYVLIFSITGTIVTAYRRQRAKCRRDVESYLKDGGWRYKRKGE